MRRRVVFVQVLVPQVHRKLLRGIAVLVLVLGASAQTYWPSTQWREATPESEGVDSEALIQMLEYIREQKIPIHALVIVRHGYVVFDASFYPYQSDWPHDLASATKSVTSLLVGIAIDRGLIHSVQDTLVSLLPEYAAGVTDLRKKKIVLENLLTMTSGLRCSLDGGEKQLRAMQETSDWAAFTMSLPMQFSPGSEFAYCSPNCHLMSCILSTHTGQSEFEFAKRMLFSRLDISDARWPTDPQGRTDGWGGLHLKPREFAKLGYLYLHGGQWAGKQIVSSSWVRASTTPQIQVRKGVAYGYNWWINTDHNPPIFEAVGRGGQRVSVIREKDAVIAFLGGGDDTDALAPFLLRALRSDSALPPSLPAARRLRALLQAARQPPPALQPNPLPSVAHAVSGKTFEIEPNPLRLQALSLSFGQSNEAQAELQLAHQSYKVPIGLDHRPRFSSHGPFGLPLAAMGAWQADGKFLLDLDTVSNINHYLIRITFERSGVLLSIDERTGELKDFVLAGHLK